jgi:hypothetical protein
VSSGPACVLAWSLAEGDVLPGGAAVVSVQRDPARGVASVATDDGIRHRYDRQDRVVVARRSVADAVTRPRWRIGVFVIAARTGRWCTSAAGTPAAAGSFDWPGFRRHPEPIDRSPVSAAGACHRLFVHSGERS